LATARAAPRRNRWFFVSLAVVAIVVPIAAFVPSIVDPTQRRGPLTPLVAAHAASMSAWLVLFSVQAWLAATARLHWHTRLGPVALVVAVAVVVTGYAASVAMARRGFDLSGDLSRPPLRALDNTVFQFGGLVIFAALVGTAMLLRRRPEVHKRLMTLAVIQALMGAPLAHRSRSRM
jgi:hypothetical protein